MELKYLPGFRNFFQSEALPGTLPQNQNSPQRVNYELYAEQISGSAFTAPRSENLKTWVYRMRPSVQHGHFEAAPQASPLWTSAFDSKLLTPNQYRWDSAEKLPFEGNFLSGIRTISGCGSPSEQKGASLGWYG
jgi:homogentisate 1,2-dioxygenase